MIHNHINNKKEDIAKVNQVFPVE